MSSRDGRPALALSVEPAAASAAGGWLPGLLAPLVESKRVSAAAALVADGERVLAAAAAGDAARGRRRGGPLFDLASLSKLWSASLALVLDRRGLLPLATPLAELWPRCDRRLGGRTLEELLRHRAGLRPWAPLYRRCRRRERVAARLLEGDLLGARAGTYSDLDYILWGLTVERALGRPLAWWLRRLLAEPLGLDWRPPPAGGGFWLPCRLGNEREVELAAAQGVRVAVRGGPGRGRVQDGNARFLGAPAGHAGLFATPWAMLALAHEWLRPGALWPQAAVRRALAGRGRHALGWRRAGRRGSGGRALGPGAFGHVGFTGGSVWIAPARDRILILLAHRTGVDVDLRAARRSFHARALETW